MDAPEGGRAPGSLGGTSGTGSHPGDAAGAHDADDADLDADVVVDVLHRIGRCPLQGLGAQPELVGWTPVRLQQAVARAWNGGLVFIDPDDDLVAL